MRRPLQFRRHRGWFLIAGVFVVFCVLPIVFAIPLWIVSFGTRFGLTQSDAGSISRYVLWGLLGIPVLLMAWWVVNRFHQREREQEERHGRRTKGPEFVVAKLFGRQSKEDGIQLQLERTGSLSRFLPASFSIPKRLESSHILIMGDTGSGKSSAIRQILRQIAGRGESAVVYDPAMDFAGEFYSAKRGDLILNPLDQRCPQWKLEDEFLQPAFAASIAAALFPEKEYEKEFFTTAPRRVFTQLMRHRPSVARLYEWMCDPAAIEAKVKGTPAAAYLDPGAPAQRAGVLSSFNLIADSLELLKDRDTNAHSFHTGEWQFRRDRWVFLTSVPPVREKLLPLHSVWLDLFILRMMEPCRNSAKPVWFVLDELASLNKLPQLHTALTENRKYGNPVVLGVQGKSQMEKRYGRDAESMLSQPATKIFLKTSEPRAAKWVSDSIGEIEVERLRESRSMGLLRSKKSFAMDIATKPLVMASEIAGLSPLRGFIKLENSVVSVKFQLAEKREHEAAFVGNSAAVQSDGVLKRAVAERPALSPEHQTPTEIFFPENQNKQAGGFIWDSKNEIE